MILNLQGGVNRSSQAQSIQHLTQKLEQQIVIKKAFDIPYDVKIPLTSDTSMILRIIKRRTFNAVNLYKFSFNAIRRAPG